MKDFDNENKGDESDEELMHSSVIRDEANYSKGTY
jgi:hypothetical protein